MPYNQNAAGYCTVLGFPLCNLRSMCHHIQTQRRDTHYWGGMGGTSILIDRLRNSQATPGNQRPHFRNRYQLWISHIHQECHIARHNLGFATHRCSHYWKAILSSIKQGTFHRKPLTARTNTAWPRRFPWMLFLITFAICRANPNPKQTPRSRTSLPAQSLNPGPNGTCIWKDAQVQASRYSRSRSNANPINTPRPRNRGNVARPGKPAWTSLTQPFTQDVLGEKYRTQ